MGELFTLVASDVRAKAEWNYERSDWQAFLKTLVTDGTFAMILYRLMQWAGKRRLVPAEMLFNRLNSILNNCVIGRGAQFGPAFVLIHATGVVINGGVTGGRGVRVEHQVTIGADRRLVPTIGDDVFVGAGAKVIGGVHIGDRARIGANAVVIADVPSDATAVGVPARVVRVSPPHPFTSAPELAAIGAERSDTR